MCRWIVKQGPGGSKPEIRSPCTQADINEFLLELAKPFSVSTIAGPNEIAKDNVAPPGSPGGFSLGCSCSHQINAASQPCFDVRQVLPYSGT
jgi:hypothetical protein